MNDCHRLELVKPDGRPLTLYSRRPITGVGPVPAAPGPAAPANPHLRWQPLRGEWVVYAAHRQGRTFLPPPEWNPLRPMLDAALPTELPQGDYEVAVFDNLYPSLSFAAHDPPASIVASEPAVGRCEVVVYSQDPGTALARLPVEHVDLLLQVWADRTRVLAADGRLLYALPFENRGVEVGVTLHHPHGQIYAYPFVPPVPARMLAREREHHERTGRALLEMLIEAELADGRRTLYAGAHAVAFVPAWARQPYEVWVAPRRAQALLGELVPEVRADLAHALATVVRKYDALWSRPFPYLLSWYQAPLDGAPHPECHLHAEFLPPYRSRERLKYLAGTELGAGTWANDTLPEDTARELRAVPVTL